MEINILNQQRFQGDGPIRAEDRDWNGESVGADRGSEQSGVDRI
jgi:hypothetical protein